MKEVMVACSNQLKEGDYSICMQTNEPIDGHTRMAVIYQGQLLCIADKFFTGGIFGSIIEKSDDQFYLVLSDADFERYARAAESR